MNNLIASALKKYSKVKLSKEDGELRLEHNWLGFIPIQIFFIIMVWVITPIIGLITQYEGIMDAIVMLMIPFPVLLYLVLCYFLNRTIITVSKSYVKVRNQPFPWWKGNKTIESRDIDQFYVVRNIATEDSSSEYEQFELKARLKNHKEYTISKHTGMELEQLIWMEKEIESFLGIPDFYVTGEYGGEPKKRRTEVRRRIWAKKGMEEATITNLQLGAFVDFQGHKYKVAHITQYDWTHGNTDRLFHLKSDTGYEPDQFLHIRKHYSSYYFFLERELTPVEVRQINLPWTNMPSYFDFEGNSYFRALLSKGKMYQNDEQKALEVEEWKYKAGNDYHIRILNNSGYISYFTGKRIDDSKFTNIVNP